ncbi:MAG: hypothetical protein ABGY75_09985, partial [Gemmataceae bacterium]
MDVRDRRRVPIAGVIVGGFLLGAGVLGLYRVADAQPLPPPDLPAVPPPAGGSPLPPPAAPTLPTLPPIEPASGNVPPVAPPAVPPAARPDELKPLPTLPEPSPLPPNAPPVKPPADPVPPPKLDPPAAKPELPPVLPSATPATDPNPKPVDPPPAGLLPPLPPADSKPVTPPPAPAEQLPPAKPESNLRPELPPPNVTQNDATGHDVLPPPAAVVPPPSSPAPGAALMTLSPHKTLLTAAAGVALAFTPVVSQAQDAKPGTPPAAVDAKAVEALFPVLDDIAAAREHGDLADGPFASIAEKLETALGAALFLRHNRSLTLSETGKSYHRTVREVLDRLDSVTDQLFPDVGKTIVSMRCTPSIATMWLAPRLGDFHARHPEIEVH